MSAQAIVKVKYMDSADGEPEAAVLKKARAVLMTGATTAYEGGLMRACKASGLQKAKYLGRLARGWQSIAGDEPPSEHLYPALAAVRGPK